MPKTARVILDGLGVPESLRWHHGALWFSDLAYGRGTVHRWVPGSGEVETVVEVPGRAGGLGWLAEGQLLVVSMDGRCVYRQELDGSLALHADLTEVACGPANDMYVDPDGYAYVGNFGFDLYSFQREHPSAQLYAPPGPPTARIACLAPDGSLLGLSSPLLLPNGTVQLAAGRLLVAESIGLRLTELTVRADGTVAGVRTWAQLVSPVLWRCLTSTGLLGKATRAVSAALDHPAIARRSSSPVSPDGIALHHDGKSVWVANSLRGECVRVGPGGRIAERVRASQHALCCVVGGASEPTLFIATAPTLDPVEAGQVAGGRIEAVEL